MAYVSKEMKTKLVAEIKKVMPKDWKASYAIKNYSTLVVTISKAPIILTETFDDVRKDNQYSVNEYHFQSHCKDKEVLKTLENIINAMNGQNYDNSDRMTDYFDVGYYIELQFGSWKKDFESTK